MSIWPIVSFGDAADITSGVTLGRKTADVDLLSVPYLRVANVKDGRLDLSEITFIEATQKEINKWRLLNGDLLLTEGGDLDKLGRGTCWREEIPLCIHQNHIFRVRLNQERHDPDYVSYQIGSAYGKAYFLKHAKKTTGLASINKTVLSAFPLISPPLEKQLQITARLKAQLAEVEIARKAAQTQKQDCLLLRSRILKDVFATLNNAPLKVLGDWAKTTSGSTPSRGNKQYWRPAEIPWVKTGEVVFAPITSTEEAISKAALAECSLTLLPAKTVLVAMYGQGKTRGQSAILEISATTNQACFAILPNETWEPDFLYYWLVASYQDLRDLSEDRGGNQANLNGALLNALEIPAPERTEQQKLVAYIKAALAEMDTLISASNATLDAIDLLPQKILAQAFHPQGDS